MVSQSWPQAETQERLREQFITLTGPRNRKHTHRATGGRLRVGRDRKGEHREIRPELVLGSP